MCQAVPKARRGFGADQIPARPLFDPDNRTLSRVGAGYRNRGKRQPGTVGFQGERLFRIQAFARISGFGTDAGTHPLVKLTVHAQEATKTQRGNALSLAPILC